MLIASILTIAMSFYTRHLGPLLGIIRAEHRQLFNRYFGRVKRFKGDARDISQQVLDNLWAGDFYRTSLGHFNFFWMRDFGTVAESLMRLGYGDRVHHTLQWALKHYKRAGKITLCIDKSGHTFNAPGKPSIDALPWLLHSIVVSKYQLSASEHDFLCRELKRYINNFLEDNGDLKQGLIIAEMRDAVYYDRSAYSLALIGRMANCAEHLKLDRFPFKPSLYESILRKHYWNGDYFNADRSNDSYSSDSALMPFFLRVVDSAAMARKTFEYINKKKLNRPYPLQYGENEQEFQHRRGMGQLIMPNYTGSSIWTWHATFYLHILKRYKHADYKQQYKRFSDLIERHKTYPELLAPDGSWYHAPFYKSDPGMVWAALFLELPIPKN